jgi:hypothetical protein
LFWINAATGQNMRPGIGQIDLDPTVIPPNTEGGTTPYRYRY